MDGGALQHKELEEIQKLVKQNKSRNRKIYLREHAQKRHQQQEPVQDIDPTSNSPQHHSSEGVITPQEQSEEDLVVETNIST